MELVNKIYILVEDKHRVIVVSDNRSLCEYFKTQIFNLFGYCRDLDIFCVDKDFVNVGTALSFEMFYCCEGIHYGE